MILSFRFAFALSALGETPRSSDCALAVWSNVVDALSADGAFSSDENPRFRAIWMLDPFALAAAPAVALAPAKVGQTLWVLLRRLGACTVRTRRGRGSEGFGPLELMPHQQGTDPPSWHGTAQPRHVAAPDQIVLAWTWFRTIARLDLTRSPALADAGLRR